MSRYPLSNDQPAQIDCRNEKCLFYKGAGKCVNVSPALTLNPNGTFVCWSKVTNDDQLDVVKVVAMAAVSDERNAISESLFNSDLEEGVVNSEDFTQGRVKGIKEAMKYILKVLGELE